MVQLPTIRLETDEHTRYTDGKLYINDHVYVFGSLEAAQTRYDEITADHAAYAERGCPAWDACMALAQELELPKWYLEDLLVIDLHFMLLEPPTAPFIWAIGERGTHTVGLGETYGYGDYQWASVQAHVEGIVRNYPNLYWHVWNGEELVACIDSKDALGAYACAVMTQGEAAGVYL